MGTAVVAAVVVPPPLSTDVTLASRPSGAASQAPAMRMSPAARAATWGVTSSKVRVPLSETAASAAALADESTLVSASSTTGNMGAQANRGALSDCEPEARQLVSKA